MRHKRSGKKLNRNSSHRKAMLRNMAVSLILSAKSATTTNAAGNGRLITTVSKAKFLRPFVERLVTLSKRAAVSIISVPEIPDRRSPAWKEWRNSQAWRDWANAVSPAVALRRRAFSLLRSDDAVSILFSELAPRFDARQGGYVRIVRVTARRVGDSGQQAMIEFVGEGDRRMANPKA